MKVLILVMVVSKSVRRRSRVLLVTPALAGKKSREWKWAQEMAGLHSLNMLIDCDMLFLIAAGVCL